MPVSNYNPQFGGKPGSAAKALAAMQHTYGAKKGTGVFYATKNKRKSHLAGRSAVADPGAAAGGMGVAGV